METHTAKELMASESNLLLGQYASTLDQKRRLKIPAAFRGEAAGGFFITQGFEQNLLAFTPNAFQALYRRIRTLNMVDPTVRLLVRLIFGSAYPTAVDHRNRILIPEPLSTFAGLSSTVLLVGQGDYFEIWSPASWSEQEAQLKDVRANANRFSALDLTAR